MQEAQKYLEADREETIELDIGGQAKPVIADKMPSADKVDKMRFMQEKVRIYLEEPTEEYGEKVVFLSVNDKPVRLMRGMEHVVERFYVESLIRARQLHYTSKVGPKLNLQTGQIEQSHNIKQFPRLLYPFNILEDSDRGMRWYRTLLAQPIV